MLSNPNLLEKGRALSLLSFHGWKENVSFWLHQQVICAIVAVRGRLLRDVCSVESKSFVFIVSLYSGSSHTALGSRKWLSKTSHKLRIWFLMTQESTLCSWWPLLGYENSGKNFLGLCVSGYGQWQTFALYNLSSTCGPCQITPSYLGDETGVNP